MNRLNSICLRRLKLITAFTVLLVLAAFQAKSQAPTITSISPTSTFPGGTLTVTGAGFNTTPANNTVFFGGVKATVTAVPDANTIVVTVPVGAMYGPISVVNTTNNRSAISLQNFIPIFSPSRSTVNSADFTSTGAALADGAAVTQLWQVAAADLDGDGKLEMITLNNGENKVFIRTNTGSVGNIAFGASNSYTLAGMPNAMAVADIDGDGRLDIVVALSNPQNNLIVLRNTGDLSTFTVSSSFAVGANPNSIAVADINADGRPDVVTGNGSNANLSVLENNSSGAGTISFAATVSLPLTGSVFANSVSISDMDGNGKPDIVTSASGGGNHKVVIYPNTGNAGDAISTGTFGTAQETVVSNLTRMAVGDLDGDNLPDILLTYASGNSILTLVNTGSFSFNQTSRNLGHVTSFISIAELNGDGKPDMLVFRHSTSLAYIYPNASTAGSINFGTGLQLATGSNPISLVAADLDGDTRPDILIGNAIDHSISIYRNTLTDPPTVSSFSPASAVVGATVIITGTNFNTTAANNIVFFGPVKATVTAAAPTSLTVTVPAGAAYAPVTVLNTLTRLSATSLRFFTPLFSPNKPGFIAADITVQGNIGGGVPAYLYSLGASDLNDDGKPDLVISGGNVGDNRVYIRRNTSTTTSVAFASSLTITVAGGLSGPGSQISFGDLDGDTKPDVVVPGANANAFVILNNVGNLTFTPVVVSSAVTPTGTAVSDLDLDGKPDIVISNYGSSHIIAYPNTTSTPGSIIIGAGITMTGSLFQTNQLVTADLDGDGKPEIIAPQGSANTIHFYRNTSTPGSIAFNSRQSENLFADNTHNASSIAVADLNNDGKPDLVVTDGGVPNASSIAILRNTSTVGSVTFSITYVEIGTAPYNQGFASFGDMNGDGKPDLVLSMDKDFNPGAGLEFRIAVLNNISEGDNISFSAPIEYISGTTAIGYSSIVSDLNGDGVPDILAPGGNSGNISAYRGSPQFAPTITSIAPLTAAPVSGQVVITGTGFGLGTNNIVRFGTVTATVTANGTGTVLTATVPRNAAYGPITVLNRSNTLSAISQDRFMPAFAPNKTALATTDFVTQGVFSTTGQLYGMAAGDLNGDGKPELVIINSGGTSSLLIYPNVSTIGGPVSLGAPTVFTPTADYDDARYISLADMDGNGWLDMVIPSYELSRVGIFLNSGTGVISTAITQSGSFLTGMGPVGVATGDLDGDGKPDIVTSNNRAQSVSVFRNTSTDINAVSFAAKQDYQLSATDAVFNLALADIDNDGKLDIISGRDINGQFGKVIMLRNTSTVGSISFTPTVSIDGPRAPWTVVPGDLNGDRLTDFVVSGAGSASTESFVYTKLSSGGALTDLTTTNINTASSTIAMGLGDLNGDGKPDLVSGTRNALPGYHTFIHPNTTIGTATSFGTRIDLPSTAMPWSVVVTDMNSDGKPDVLMGNQLSSQSTITIFRNTLIASPVVQASGISVTGLTGTTATFSWTNGTGSKRALFIKQDNTASSAAPVTGTDYAANSVFGSGDQIDGTGWYCVYNGTGTITSVSGFTPSTTYRIMVTEYNDGGLTNTAQYNSNATAGNPLTLTTRSTVTAISRTTASSTINTFTADYRMTFNANMTGLSVSNFSLATSGITGASVTGVAGSGTTFTVTVNTGSGDGTVGLNLTNVAGMIPGVTNPLPYTGEVYTTDKTAPTLSPVTITSSHINTARAKSGDIVTLSFTSSETITAPTVTLAGHTVTATNTGGNAWTAAWTMTGTDVDGMVAFNIAFSDLVGNAGTAVSATTNSSSVVFDRTAPTLSPVTIASNNSNTTWARQGNTVTLGFTADETINTPVVTIAGHTVTANNTSANNWTASYTMTGSDAEGPVAFTIVFGDITGNAGTTVTTTTNSSSVVYDISNPSLPAVGIASSNSTSGKAKTGDVITLNFSASEGITPSVTIAGQAVTPVNTGGTNWTASYTLTLSDAEGTIPFNISFADGSGNAGTPATATTNSSSVVFDRTTPTLSPVAIVSSNTNTARAKTADMVTLSFTAAESVQAPVVQIAGHTVTPINVSGNAWTASYTMTGSDAEGSIPFSIAFNDLAGNAGTTVTATTNSSSIVFDRTVPNLSSVAVVSNNSNTARARTGDMVTLNFTADETVIPSVQIAGHTITPINTSGNAWTAAYTMTGTDGEGNIPFTIVFNDLYGNTGTPVSATTNSSVVVFDRTVPTLSPVAILSNNTINTAKARTGDRITVSFTASEEILTPTLLIAAHSITPVNITGNVWTGSYTMTGTDAAGNIPFSISFVDRAGNSGTSVTASTNSSSVLFDKTIPVLTVVGILSDNPNARHARTGNRITLNFTASEGILSPTLSIASHSITPVITSGTAWTAAYTMTTSDNEGIVPFSILFTDLAGNEGISVTGTTDNSAVVFDRTIPVLHPVSITSNNALTQTALPGNEVTLSFTASEGGLTPTVSIAGHAVTATGSINNVWTASVVMHNGDAEGWVPFSITAVDRAGNTTAVITITTDNSKVNFIKPTSPYFSNGTVQNLVICQDITADISNLLKVTHTANGQPVTITVTGPAAQGTLSGFNARLMSNGGINTPAGLSYKPAAGFSGTDLFTLMVTDGTITSTTTINVTVNVTPSGSITAAGGTSLCAGSVLTLTASGGSTYKWYKDGILINGVTTSQLGVTTPGVYTAMLASAAGCESPAANSITITLIQQPKADFTIGSNNACINVSVPFTSNSTTANSGTVHYLWTDGQGQTSTAASASFLFTQAGTYNVKLKLTPQLCPALADSMTKPVTITQAVAGIRNPSMDVAVSVGTTLQARTLPNATYQWTPARYLVSSNVPNPVTFAAEEQEYLIRLTVPNGCVTIDTLLVRIHPNATAYLPNVFTPNGDGQNDVLMPTLVGVKQLRYFRIFNRWGKLMFETFNIGIGWDGRYNGVLQPMETYTWSIEGYDSNNVLVKRQGSVTLLR
jgi:gliding motility-associated-like protein